MEGFVQEQGWRLCWVRTRTIEGLSGSFEEVLEWRPIVDDGSAVQHVDAPEAEA